MKPLLVHIHIFYDFLWPELKECLKSIEGYSYDLVITMVEDKEVIRQEVEHSFPNAKVLIVKNIGFNVYPFLCVINDVELSNYSYIIKLHTKRDIPFKDSFFWFRGNKWRNALLSFVKSKSNFNKAIKKLHSCKNIGMHGPCTAIINNFCDDQNARSLTNQFILEHNLKRLRYKFVGGSMFIVKSTLLKPLIDLNIKSEQFDAPDA